MSEIFSGDPINLKNSIPQQSKWKASLIYSIFPIQWQLVCVCSLRGWILTSSVSKPKFLLRPKDNSFAQFLFIRLLLCKWRENCSFLNIFYAVITSDALKEINGGRKGFVFKSMIISQNKFKYFIIKLYYVNYYMSEGSPKLKHLTTWCQGP